MDSGIKTDKVCARGRTFWLIAAIILVMVLIMELLSYSVISAGFKNISSKCNASLAASAAENLDGDIFERVIENGKGSEEYNYVLYILSGYMQAAHETYAYAMARSEDGAMRYIAGAYPPGQREFGREYEKEPGMMTVQVPIHNSKMDIVGVVAVDSSVKEITKNVNDFMIKTFFVALSGILVCVLFIIVVKIKLGNCLGNNKTGRRSTYVGNELEIIGKSLNMLLENTSINVGVGETGDRDQNNYQK